jgi:hypothetical protein
MIPDNYKLLGLIVNTIPFNYKNNNVTAEFSGYVEIQELVELKNQLEITLTNLPESASDKERLSISDDILFMTTMIENLNRASE